MAFREKIQITAQTDHSLLFAKLKSECIPYSIQVKKDGDGSKTYLIISSAHAPKVLFLMKKYRKQDKPSK